MLIDRSDMLVFHALLSSSVHFGGGRSNNENIASFDLACKDRAGTNKAPKRVIPEVFPGAVRRVGGLDQSGTGLSVPFLTKETPLLAKSPQNSKIGARSLLRFPLFFCTLAIYPFEIDVPHYMT